jgi:peptide chain release factor
MNHIMYRLGVNSGKAKALLDKLHRLGILAKDVDEKFVRSSGRGGQKVNKTSSCVYLKHRPTGIEVKMQRERSQPLNRFLAWRLLAEKIERLKYASALRDEQTHAKIARVTRPKPYYAKQSTLHDKHFMADKKQLRQPVKDIEE